MNKALLIIICDFLLLSLLSLANFDQALDKKEKPAPPEPVSDMTTSQSDLMMALQSALEEEQSSREELQTQLADTLNQVKTQEQLLAEREANVQNLEQDLMSTEERAALLEQERQALDLQITDTVRNLVEIEDQLNDANVESRVSNAKLESMQSELQMRERAARQLQNKLEKVEERQRATEQEKQKLAIVLKETEVERNMVREQLVVTKEQVQQEKLEKEVIRQEKEVIRQEKEVIREEKAEIQKHATVLAEGVGALAEKSGELTEEIRENRPLTGNLIFSGFISNRVDTEFTARKSGILGKRGDTKNTKTVLVSSGDKIFALYHAQDTLLNLNSGETSWEYLYAHLRHGFALISLEKISFLQSDPRIVLAEVTPEQAKDIGVDVYPLAAEPYKFNEAVLVGGSGQYYGESPFQIAAGAPQYVKMEKRRFNKFFGNFSPSRGDLVFSKTGEILGIMVNKEYCMVLSDLTAIGEVTLGPKIQNTRNARVLSDMAFRIGMLPNQVQ